MIRVMDTVKQQPMRYSEQCLDSQLWHACAGGMVQMPQINSKVFYFPQGHAEHAYGKVDFGTVRIPPLILSRVSAIKYLADTETDEVFAKIRLIPLSMEGHDLEDGFIGSNDIDSSDKSASFAKTLTQSDANNGGGFSVPRYCAETIFPRLDYSAEPPVQTILAKDVHGEIWKFRHIYRGTPRRHLLTTGWSHFVNQKKLIAGDSIVFLRAENGDLCVGIRRAKRGIGVGPDFSPGWTAASGNCGPPFGGYSAFIREDGNNLLRASMSKDLGGRVRAESVVEAAKLAASGQPFEVIYYPRGSTPEFFVKASSVKAAMQIQWCSGMRFKMAFETEDSSRISWFMGTISAVHVADPIRWPNSPWRLLQVAWDEPDLLQNVKRVSPWLVELVSNMPAIHLSPITPPRKKIRLPQHPDISLMGQLSVPPFSNNPLWPSSPLCCIADNFPGGIQGARHAQLGLSPSDHFFNKMQTGLHPFSFQQVDVTASTPNIAKGNFIGNHVDGENVSCVLTMGSSDKDTKKNSEIKNPQFVLFGQVILTEGQTSQSSSGDTSGNSLSDGNMEKTNCSDGSGSGTGLCINFSNERLPWYKKHLKSEYDFENGHCEVFVESDDVGRTLDLSDFSSYEELYEKLANMFGIESLDIQNNSLYQDASGATKRAGDEPFSEFLKTVRRLTIHRDSSIDNV